MRHDKTLYLVLCALFLSSSTLVEVYGFRVGSQGWYVDKCTESFGSEKIGLKRLRA